MGNCSGARPKDDHTLSFQPTSAYIRSTHYKAHSSTTVHGCSGKGKSETLPAPRFEGDILSSSHLKAFTFNELKNATRNFRPDSLIGEGGFGNVYKGWINDQTLGPARPGSGMVVAVKKLKPEGFQGHKEWLSEVNYLGQVHHPNLVKLIGFCLEGDKRLLVYEYMPKGSLENHLFHKIAQPFPWATRIKVASDAARCLTFLHDSKQIIYRDFKTSNILLDSDFNAKLSDFGLAREAPTGDRTHVSTEVLGTQGYAAPEYIATGWLTTKCDVYSFGVVLLELLSGRHAFDKSKAGVEYNLVDWARPYLGDRRKLFRIMDTKLEGRYPQREAHTVSMLALQCVSGAKIRPQMSEVLATLEQLPSRTRPERMPVSSPPGERRSFSSQPSPMAKSPLRHNHQSAERKSISSHTNDSAMRSALASPLKSPLQNPCGHNQHDRNSLSLNVDSYVLSPVR